MNVHHMIKALAAIAIVASTAPAAAAIAAQSKAETEDRKRLVNEAGEALTCKNIRMTGTRLPKQVCATAKEWKVLEAEGY